MATLNLSTNGPSITKSYQAVINSSPASGAAASSATYGQWALYTVAAPLVSAFQPDGVGKESVLKVQSTGEGELSDLIEDFSDGRIQFAFLKVKDPNTTLPKSVLISWGYHIEITARSERDLTPESVLQKVADASGSKYSGGGSVPAARAPPPALSSKPVFTPTQVSGGSSTFGGPGSRSRSSTTAAPVDNDGWGADAPELTRTQLEKVGSAYKPTKVNLAELQAQKESSGYNAPQSSNGSREPVRGAYQPVGKVDIAEIRRMAAAGGAKDDRPTIVKGAYEPVGKVDIAAIRARAQGSSASPGISPAVTGASGQSAEQEEQPKSLAERSGAFTQSERLTSLPKPKVANKFGASSSFTGTKAPAPGGFSSTVNSSSAPVGIASRTFADEGGKTPAQIWAEKKARQGSGDVRGLANNGDAPIGTQSSGEGGWKSGYTGKSWGAVHTNHNGTSVGSNMTEQRTGGHQEEPEPTSPPGGVGSIRDRFSAQPPPMDISSKPNSGIRGVPMPGLPSRPSGVPAEHHVDIPPPPAQPRSPSPPTPDERSSSPIRVAMPVSRTKEPEAMEAPEERFSSPPMPTQAMGEAARRAPDEPRGDNSARGAGQAAAASTFGADAASANPGAGASGKRAIIQYDYEKAEDNELELREGEYVTNIEMVDEDWWMGQNERGEAGLFPSNYVELVEEDAEPTHTSAPAVTQSHAEPPAPPAAAATGGGKGKTATAQYDYEAAEDNELSFPDGATITNLDFPDDDWWFGEYGGKTGLFPANYVELD